MKRIHAVELEDLSWFPESIRNYGTDYLQFIATTLNVYSPILPWLFKGLESLQGKKEIIDMASGGGGGWPALAPHLTSKIKTLTITLTDQYPHIKAFQRIIDNHPETFNYNPAPVDARHVSQELTGLRTMFLSFHHFHPENAQRILQNAVESDQPILIAEAQERTMINIIKFLFTPLFVLLATPMIRPLSLGRFLFTYLIPAVPLLVLWDGIISVLRTYTPGEMLDLAQKADPDFKFTWEAGKAAESPAPILYLLGRPEKSK